MAKKEYVEMNGILGEGYDYHVYHMKKNDYLAAYGLGFLLGFVIIWAFFDSVLFGAICGIIVALKVPKFYGEYKRKKRLKELRSEFKDLLESLSASYSAGRNTTDAFRDALTDMTSIYGEHSDIVKEVQIICAGVTNNINVENLLLDFANRCGIDDVMSFANVFDACNRQGGDLKRIVNETRDVINDKIEVEMEIETMIAGNKNELNIMMVMPVVIVIMLRMLGEGTVNANNFVNIIVKIVCIGIFVLSYVIGKKIVDIKI